MAVAADVAPAGAVRRICDHALAGERITEEEAAVLFSARGRSIWEIAIAADALRQQRVGDAITFVRNQNLNITNICINTCGFCGFSRKSGDPDAYRFGKETVQEKAAVALSRGVTEICTVSGLHPDFTGESYTDLIRWIAAAAPGIHIHASNPMEIAYGAQRSGISTKAMLQQMKEAGLGSLCGTAAEILVDDVRKRICPGKCDTATWERIIREAHAAGIPTTATIMYGHVESVRDRARHLAVLRSIQDDTGGFTEFVPLSFIHRQTPLYRQGKVAGGATGREDLLMYAVSRLFLDNFDNIQVSWVKIGTKMAQLGLCAGANDLGGTMYEESISKGAGAKDTDYLDPAEMRRIAEDLGRDLEERTTLYRRVPAIPS
ncbi:MAG: 5-amino-6-(D-ribitylamino)uracil--L-tyrosine 4-hydroxyphenyl transferase CofH [Methanomicrobiales archaeon]|nr:5-amino-6-(D-ribitylamino)uracil--L-tyrosine 4-hydroxyphenyl transferase CofH [Methanomicrobiales archaeon]